MVMAGSIDEIRIAPSSDDQKHCCNATVAKNSIQVYKIQFFFHSCRSTNYLRVTIFILERKANLTIFEYLSVFENPSISGNSSINGTNTAISLVSF